MEIILLILILAIIVIGVVTRGKAITEFIEHLTKKDDS